MKYWFIGALAGVFVLGFTLTAPVIAQAPASSWNVGDVFVGVGVPEGVLNGGAYRALTPQGVLKGEPALESLYDQATGCAVDVGTGDLFTTGFWNMSMSRFGGAGGTHSLLATIDLSTIANIPMSLPPGKPAPSWVNNYNSYPDPPNPNLPLRYTMAVESVVFNKAGDMFVGAQQLPEDESTWLGHAWVLKLSKTGTLLDWWQVDSGDLDNPTRNTSVSIDVHGVDWLDLSADETTIYYTSEDGMIRSFRIAGQSFTTPGTQVGLAGEQGPSVAVHRAEDGKRIANKTFAVRILPPGDPANGFLVATQAGVHRVKQNGEIVKTYLDLGVLNYFALNITPDGQSFWTATFDGGIYRFHIGSGTMAGPFSAGFPAAGGICVKREYTAVQNVCFETTPEGDAQVDPDNPPQLLTKTCKLPPPPGACSGPDQDPDCYPPGTVPSLVLAKQLTLVNTPVSYQPHGVSGVGDPLSYSISGLPSGLNYDMSTGLISGTPNTAVNATVTVTVTDTLNMRSTTKTFTWMVYGNPSLVIPNQGHPVGTFLSYPLPGQAAPAGLPLTYTLIGALPTGLSLSGGVISGTPTVLVKAQPVTIRVTQTVTPTITTTTETTFPWTIYGTPTLVIPNKFTQVGTPLSPAYQVPGVSVPSGLDLSYSIVSGTLPAGLSMSAAGLISGTPTTPVNATPLRIRVTQTAVPGATAFADADFTWTVYDKPSLVIPNQASPLGSTVNYVLPGQASPTGLPLTYALVSGTLPAGLTLSAGKISGTATPLVNATPLTIRVTQTVAPGITTTADAPFTWTIYGTPGLAVPDQFSLPGAAVSYQLPGVAVPSGLPLSYSLISGTLPAGLSMTAAGLISGTTSTLVTATPLVVRVTQTIPGVTPVVTTYADAAFKWTVSYNQNPVCTGTASIAEIWPPNHKMVSVNVVGVTDPDPLDSVTIKILGIYQDEPTNTDGDGTTAWDGEGVNTPTARVRAERTGQAAVPGNGRVYQIRYTASDGKGGSCVGSVTTGVPHDLRKGHVIFDDGIRYDSTVIGGPQVSPTTFQPLLTASLTTASLTTNALPAGARGGACYAGSTPLNTAEQGWVVNGDGTITIRTALGRSYADNTYGKNAMGYPKSHKLGDMASADGIMLRLYDALGVKQMEFTVDYLSASKLASDPSGYGTLGVSGGEGIMLLGSAADIVRVQTSLDVNLNSPGYVLVSDSPVTDAAYTPNASYPDWIYDIWYDVTVKPGAFGSAGFGKSVLVGAGAGPSKTGVDIDAFRPVACSGGS
jgi:putative Ig domain-containing protein